MEKQLKCVLLLPLKEMALRRVVALFWSSPDSLSYILKVPLWGINYSMKEKLQVTFREKIINKVLKLVLPGKLMKQLIATITPISLEMVEWKMAHQSFLNSTCKIDALGAAKLCWTTAGTINYHKTAEELVRCSKMDIEIRYEIACYYCLEDYISLFWMELPERAKEKYSKGKVLSPLLPYCWPHILQGRRSELDYLWSTSERNLTSFNQCVFEYYAGECCKVAAEYFLQKLTHEERDLSLIRSFHAVLTHHDGSKLPKEKLSHVLFFLLTAMTPEKQMEAFLADPVSVIFCFLQWPLQDLFTENTNLFWTLFPPNKYIDLTKKIIQSYHYSDFDFPKTFEVFITQSPPDFKRRFVDEEFDACTGPYPRNTAAGHFLKEFFLKDDSESIQVFLRNLDADDRVKIVCRYSVLKLFYEQVARDGCDLVLLCFQDVSLSKEEKVKIKEFFTRRLEYKRNRMYVEWKFQRIFDFLNESDACSAGLKVSEKRKLEHCSPE